MEKVARKIREHIVIRRRDVLLGKNKGFCLILKGLLNPFWILEVSVTLDEVSIFILSLSNF